MKIASLWKTFRHPVCVSTVSTYTVSAAVAALVLLAAGTLKATTTVTTQPVGYTTTNCLANSDTIVSLPFTRAPAFIGTVASISGATVTPSGTPGWTEGQFVYQEGTQSNTYYVLLGPVDGASSDYAQDGRIYPVTANTATSLTIDALGDDLSGVPADAKISIIPYWTLNTVFPASDAGVSFIASSSPLITKTQIFIPDYGGAGTNLSSIATYYFYNGAWRLTGDSVKNDHGDDVLLQDRYLIMRNTATSSVLNPKGNVVMQPLSIPLLTETNSPQDNFVSVTRPLGVTLDNSGLVSSGVFTASPSPLLTKDQLFVYNNTQQVTNKSTSATYYYYNGAWRQVGLPVTKDVGSTVLPIGSGIVIRKVATANGETQFWNNSPSY